MTASSVAAGTPLGDQFVGPVHDAPAAVAVNGLVTPRALCASTSAMTAPADAISSAAARLLRCEMRRGDDPEAAEMRIRFVSFIIVRAPTRNLKQRPLQNRVPI